MRKRATHQRLRDLVGPRVVRASAPTISPGDLIVADPFARAIIRVRPRSGEQALLFWHAQLVPWSVAVAADGTIVAGLHSDVDGRAELVVIQAGTSTGRSLAAFPGPKVIHGIAVTPGGGFALAVTGLGGVADDAVYRIDAQGRLTLRARHETIPIVAGPHRTLFVSARLKRDEPAILRMSLDSRASLGAPPLEAEVVARGGHLRPWLAGLAVSGGALYATVRRDGPGRVVRVDPATGVQAVVASGSVGGLLSRPFGIAAIGSRTLAVVNYDHAAGAPTGTVVVVNPQSGSQTLLASGGLLVQPFAIAVAR